MGMTEVLEASPRPARHRRNSSSELCINTSLLPRRGASSPDYNPRLQRVKSNCSCLSALSLELSHAPTGFERVKSSLSSALLSPDPSPNGSTFEAAWAAALHEAVQEA